MSKFEKLKNTVISNEQAGTITGGQRNTCRPVRSRTRPTHCTPPRGCRWQATYGYYWYVAC